MLGAAMLAGMLINFSGINPIRTLVVSAALNGSLTPPLLILLVRISCNREILGGEVSGGWLTGLLWGTIVIMTIGALALLFTLL